MGNKNYCLNFVFHFCLLINQFDRHIEHRRLKKKKKKKTIALASSVLKDSKCYFCELKSKKLPPFNVLLE